MQAMVDGIHGEFAGHVARARGLSKDALAKVANGRVFLANEAKAHGLIDGIATFPATYNALLSKSTKVAPLQAAHFGDVALRAAAYVRQQAKLGKTVTTADAVAHISNTL
jgi:ClpP class serine protease